MGCKREQLDSSRASRRQASRWSPSRTRSQHHGTTVSRPARSHSALALIRAFHHRQQAASTSAAAHSTPQHELAQESRPTKHQLAQLDLSDSDEDLLTQLEDELDNDFDLGGFRERRMDELRAQSVASRRAFNKIEGSS